MKKSLKKIQIIIAIVLFLLSVFLYLLFHGTENLIVVDTINSIIHLIPVVPRIKIKVPLINGYLVDILWFTSFVLLSPQLLFSDFINSIIILVFASLLEILQLFFPVLGTFDFFDILCYFGVFLLYNLFVFVIKKERCRNVVVVKNNK